jgi:hypothetical protein
MYLEGDGGGGALSFSSKGSRAHHTLWTPLKCKNPKCRNRIKCRNKIEMYM